MQSKIYFFKWQFHKIDEKFYRFFFLLDSTVEEDQLSSCSDDSQKKNEETKAQCQIWGFIHLPSYIQSCIPVKYKYKYETIVLDKHLQYTNLLF